MDRQKTEEKIDNINHT